MQTALFEIWIWFVTFITYNSNHYNTSASYSILENSITLLSFFFFVRTVKILLNKNDFIRGYLIPDQSGHGSNANESVTTCITQLHNDLM